WLPMIEYAKTGARMGGRFAGKEERQPIGLLELPTVIVPDIFGRTQRGSLRVGFGNQIESSAAAYAGVYATLFVAPLAWCSRRRFSMKVFWSLAGLLSLGWCLDVPGIVDFLRLPGLNMMSHNRLVFVTSFSILVL